MRKYIFILCLCAVFVSCKDSEKDKMQKVVAEWIGKEFIFNESLSHIADSCYTKDSIPYFLVYYVDSETCVTCRIPAWIKMITNLEEHLKHEIPCCLIVSPECDSHIEPLLKGVSTSKSWLIDTDSEILKSNHIPGQDLLNAMLIDHNHKVIAIGNPVTMKPLRTLFLKRMLELDKTEPTRNVP